MAAWQGSQSHLERCLKRFGGGGRNDAPGGSWEHVSDELDARMRPEASVDPRFGVGGVYLDPTAAAASIERVRNQGRSVVTAG